LWFKLSATKLEKVPNESLKKAMDYILQNYSKNLTLTTVSEYVHLNPNYLSTLFTSQLKCSFREYLTKIRIEESKHLLKKSNMGILEIALTVGFESQSYYSRVFKKLVGLSPKAYRNRVDLNEIF
ncbi:MAG: AraC family transcriptional regulator, partial [Lachnospiraceae bacterium]|nr:AraC family transcriptional regulator [Lachnospiraceae bacterium]